MKCSNFEPRRDQRGKWGRMFFNAAKGNHRWYYLAFVEEENDNSNSSVGGGSYLIAECQINIK
ncbi:MAG: hypothetical protein AB8B59_05855 [Maribacter sp.]